MIMAFAETLGIEWKDMGQIMLLLRTRTNLPRDSISLKGQLLKTSSEGLLLDLLNMLYIDDGAFTFENRKQLILGSQLIFVRYRLLARRLHPDKHDTEATGMTSEEAVEMFKLVNNAQKYLRENIMR